MAISLNIQYVSDIHLERNLDIDFNKLVDISNPADVLILAGDIGCPKDPRFKAFLLKCNAHFKTTILVPGNHEYYSCFPDSLESTEHLMHKLCGDCSTTSSHKVIFLHKGNKHVVGHVNFIGATLWSHIPVNLNETYLNSINSQVFRGIKISEKDGALTVNSHNELFRKHLSGIEKSIEWGKQHNKKNVVITHHAPFMKAFKSEDLPKNHLYATELSQYLSYDSIHTWIYGHTHWNSLTSFNGTLVTCNQFGGPKGIRGWRAFATLMV